MPFLPQNVTIVGNSGQHVFRNVKRINVRHGNDAQAPIKSRVELRPDGTKIIVPRTAEVR